MEGPTPVSALIHAATMVTAGVYLIARSNPIYDQTDTGRLVVAIIGAITLLIGAIIGCAYDDIKKVLAYSTVSQIGYMFLAVGLGPAGYALGIIHLLAHGFFKAGLFLGAGSVMHAMNDQVDMRRFGGLWKLHADHLRDVRARLPRDHRLPVPVRATSPRTRSSRRRSTQDGLAGLALRRRRPARRRAHRLLHDPAGGDDLPRRAPVEEAPTPTETAQDYHPHESPAGHDDPDDRAGGRARSARVPCSAPSASPTGSRRRWAS